MSHRRNHADVARISFSELKTWNECAYKHKLVYLDKEDHFNGNEYTAFGTSIHLVCEKLVVDECPDPFTLFKESFKQNLQDVGLSIEDYTAMVESAKNIIPHIMPTVESYFGKYEVISVEQLLLEDINDFDSYGKKFKGFIDLVLKTEDNKYHVIDWKTCSWGWDAKKRSDTNNVYQLTLYKKFFSEKFNISCDNIETYFALLKRTAKKNNVEFIKVSNKKRRTQNAVSLLERAIKNIESKNFIKNRLSCKYCSFYKTDLCP